MYSLDINFLNDREERPLDLPPQAQAGAPGERRPLYIGAVVGLAALALMGGYWAVLQHQIRQLEARDAELDREIAALQSQLQQISSIQAQVDLVQAENQAIVSQVDKIRPWSALLQDIRDRIPARVQITEMSQTAGQTPEGDESAPAAGGIEIVGQACSFDDVNDFVLVLQQSRLLDGNTVQLVDSQRQDQPLPREDGTCPNAPAGSFTFLVDYTIQANMTGLPASQLVEELASQGTVGLVSRIRALRETGVLQP